MTLEDQLRLAAEWRARVTPAAPLQGARRALSAEELAALDADLAARQMIGDVARGLGAYARPRSR